MTHVEKGFKGSKLVGAKLDGSSIVTKTVTVTAGSASGTATVTAGSKIIGFYPTTNQDQIVKGVAISGTTLTVTLNANATANNVIAVNLVEA